MLLKTQRKYWAILLFNIIFLTTNILDQVYALGYIARVSKKQKLTTVSVSEGGEYDGRNYSVQHSLKRVRSGQSRLSTVSAKNFKTSGFTVLQPPSFLT